jgi:hypothetical protein
LAVATRHKKSLAGILNTQTSVKLSAMLGSGINGVINKVIRDKMDTVSAHVVPLTFLS